MIKAVLTDCVPKSSVSTNGLLFMFVSPKYDKVHSFFIVYTKISEVALFLEKSMLICVCVIIFKRCEETHIDLQEDYYGRKEICLPFR